MKIISAKTYRAYMHEMEDLIGKDPMPKTRAGKRLLALAIKCEAYEEKRWGKAFKTAPSAKR